MTSVFFWQNSVSLCRASFCTSKAKFACYSRYLLTSYFCIPVPYNEKDIVFGCQFQKVLQVLQNCSTSVSSALLVDVRGVLKSLVSIVFPSVSPFMSDRMCFIYLGAPVLGSYILVSVSSSCIDPFFVIQCPSVSFFMAFVLKSILSDRIL